MDNFHRFNSDFVGIGFQIGGLDFAGPRIEQLPRDNRLMIFIEQLNRHRSAIWTARFVAFLEHNILFPFVEKVEIAFKSAAFEGQFIEFSQARLLAFGVGLIGSFAVLNDLALETQTRNFGKSDAKIFAPIDLKMKLRQWVISFGCHILSDFFSDNIFFLDDKW